MNTVRFSIVIPNYNRAQLLNRCLRSIINQTYKNWEAIVVDNFSTDESEQVANSFRDSRIKFVKNHNYGIISISRNKAIDLSTGEWLCFLDSDDYWATDKLESLLPFVDDYDFIYHDFQKLMPSKRLFQRTVFSPYDIEDVSLQYVLKRGDPINTSSACVSKKALGDIRFSEDKKLFAIEDYDFFLQLFEKHLNVKHLKKVLTYYEVATGCSHGRDGIDRSRRLYIKYWDKLSSTDRREVLKYHMYQKGCYFYENVDYKNARNCFYVSLFSTASNIRKGSFLAIIKSFILQLSTFGHGK